MKPGPAGARLDRLRQVGSAKAFIHPGFSGPEVVFLNTSGGLAGGDILDYRLDIGPCCRATGTTQTAERAYRSMDGPALVTVHHMLSDGAHLDWLPQETILFEQSALSRETTIDLGRGASCLMLESVILGRAAMGETIRNLAFEDRRTIRREGRPILMEPVRIGTDALDAGSGVLNGNCAFATLALVAEGADFALAPVRDLLDEPGTTGGASAFDGKLIVRLMAADGWPLRRQILRLLSLLMHGPLPRVWQL